MPKTVVLKSKNQELEKMLEQRGYKVIDIYDAMRPGMHADAFLYTGFHPDMLVPYHSAVTDDITLGFHIDKNEISPLTINITGMTPDQIIVLVDQHFSFKRI